MASSLGSIVVSLGLDAAQFTSGLTKAEYQARKFGETLGSNIRTATLATTAALGGLAGAALAANAAFNKLLDGAAQFQDLAEMTGTSAQDLASFAVAAGTAGVSVDSVAQATIKLTKNLVGVDDESKAAGAALAALGIKVEDFKKLDPATQYETVSKALAGFSDGAEKTAVALALFGKSGAEQLKVMAALEEQGGRQVILTGEQIAQSDAYRDAQAKLTAQLSLYASAIATEFIGPTNALIAVLKDAAAEMYATSEASKTLGASNGIQRFAEDSGSQIARFIDYVRQSAKELQVLTDFVNSTFTALKQVATFDFAGARATGEEFRKRYGLDEFGRKIQQESGKEAAKTFVDAYNAQLAASKRTAFAATDPRRVDLVNGKAADTRPTINFQGATPKARSVGSSRTRAEKDPTSEAQRYLETLQKQLEATQELTVQEQVLQDIQLGRLGQVTTKQKEDLLNTAAQIDAARARKAADEEAARVQKQMASEAKSLYEQTRTPLETFNAQQDRLNQLLEAGAIDFVTAARAGEMYKKQLEESTKVVSEMDEFTKNAVKGTQDALAGFLTDLGTGARKTWKEVGDGFANMLVQMAAQAVAADLTKKLFGSNGGAGGQGEGWLGSLLQMFAGSAGKAAGGNVSPFSLHRVNENGPELLDVNGKQYLMNGGRNATVTPNSKIGAAGGTSYISITVPGNTDSRTALQIADKTALRQRQARRYA